MEKYLFTDGTAGVKEVHSLQQLQQLADSATRPDAIRIWLFSSNEWISYAAFLRQQPPLSRKNNSLPAVTTPVTRSGQLAGKWRLKNFLYATGFAAGAFLVFNFTKIKWEKAEPVNLGAARPLNVPFMDIDSLVTEIEYARGKPIDRNTRTNLRLRNTWPDRILLQLKAEKETSTAGSRFSNLEITVDNTTGFNLDHAVAKLFVWQKNKATIADTIRFGEIRYDKIAKRQLNGVYRGDSITVSFESIKAKAFNFCYADKVKNNSGNYNDRWFCRE